MARQLARCPRCEAAVEFDAKAGALVECPSCRASLTWPGQAAAAARPDPLVGQRLGDFEIVAPLGRGGMGAVYRARQVSLDRAVAVKVLSRGLSRDAAYVARFEREARAAAAVNHPNIVRVIAFGEDQGRHYIAMELVEGESLADLLRREGRLPAGRLLGLLKQLAAALAHAHEQGIVHRDIKPSNILIEANGTARIADFGLARRLEGDMALTQLGVAMGTPLYMAPEVAAGQPAEPRSDLYSLGATAYHALAGRPPFQGTTASELAIKHVQVPAPPLVNLAPDAPRPLCRLIHRLLRKRPEERFPRADRLLGELNRLEAWLSASPADATQAMPVRVVGVRRRPRRRRVVLALVGGAALAIAAVLLAANSRRPRESALSTDGAAARRSLVPHGTGRFGRPADPPKSSERPKTDEGAAEAVLPIKPSTPPPPPPPPPEPQGPFHGALKMLPDGRMELHYDFTNPAELQDWRHATGGEPSLADGEVRFGGPGGNCLMFVAPFTGDIEIAGTWRVLKAFQPECDCSVNFCNTGERYYGVSLASYEQKIFKDNGWNRLRHRAAKCPHGVSHSFRIVRAGQSIKVWVDGESCIEASDRDYTGGALGVGAWFTATAIEEFRILGRLDLAWLASHPDAGAQLEAASPGDDAVPRRSQDGLANLALLPQAKANASSVWRDGADPRYQAAHLRDGLYNNKHSWIARTEPSWAEIDLGAPRLIRRVVLTNEQRIFYNDRAAKRLVILAAADYDPDSAAATWQRVVEFNGPALHGSKAFDLAPVVARWVRVVLIDSSRPPARLDEIEVYGSDSEEDMRRFLDEQTARKQKQEPKGGEPQPAPNAPGPP